MRGAISKIDPSTRRLVFLVGAQRSGTTWLQLMLAASQHVATVNETHLFSQYLHSQFETWERLKDNIRAIGLAHVMEEAEFLALIRQFCDGVLNRVLAAKPGATVILEKTPDHVRHWRHILKVYPDACFVHVVRDPRAVVASMRAASRSWGGDWAPPGVVENCARWRECVEEGRRIRDATPNTIEVRYEDLKSDCAAALGGVFAWMGIALSSEKCTEIAQRYRIDRLRAGTIDDTPWDLATEPPEFYRRGETDGWKRELTRRQAYLVESMTRDLMDVYRYAPAGRSRNQRAAARLVLAAERLRPAVRSRAKRLVAVLWPKA